MIELGFERRPQGTGRKCAPVADTAASVHDRDGNIVNGLQPREFHLTDNGKEQNIAVDVTYHPISLALVIQANGAVDAILPQVKRIGSLLESLVVGDQGEVAVAAFDHRFLLKQDFTTELPKISEALKKITSGSSTSALIDAMDEVTVFPKLSWTVTEGGPAIVFPAVEFPGAVV